MVRDPELKAILCKNPRGSYNMCKLQENRGIISKNGFPLVTVEEPLHMGIFT